MSELKKRIKAAISDIKRDEMYFASDLRTFEFIEHNPENVDSIIVNEKISAMNNGLIDVHYVPAMAEHIIKSGIDNDLARGDLSVVTRIAAMDEKQPGKFKKFASRYCNFHKPEIYPVETEVSEELMKLYLKDSDTPAGLPQDFSDYPNFKKVLDSFISEYEFGAFNYYEMEKCLWLKSVNIKRYFTDPNIKDSLKE